MCHLLENDRGKGVDIFMIIKEVTRDLLANAVTFKYLKKGEEKFRTGIIKATKEEPIDKIVEKLDKMAETEKMEYTRKKGSYGNLGKIKLTFLCLHNQRYYENIGKLADDFGWNSKNARNSIVTTGKYKGFRFEVFRNNILIIPRKFKDPSEGANYKRPVYLFDIEGTVKSDIYWTKFFKYKTVNHFRKKLLTGNYEGLEVKFIKKKNMTERELKKWI